jgi:class 3 adenylate cyclase
MGVMVHGDSGGAMAAAQPIICKGCWGQMHVPIPIRGPLSLPFRLFGIRRSRMNPNLCTICELMFKVVMRRRNIEAELTILFVDLRGYSELSRTAGAEQVHELLNIFYDECAGAIWEHDGLLNMTIGDAILAIFNFPISRPDHTAQAVAAARELRERCAARKAALAADGLDPTALQLGIGIHTGLAAFGEFGQVHKDFTAIGNTVNLAARLQAAAQPGEILVSAETFAKLDGEASEGTRVCRLKGFADPVTAYLM